MVAEVWLLILFFYTFLLSLKPLSKCNFCILIISFLHRTCIKGLFLSCTDERLLLLCENTVTFESHLIGLILDWALLCPLFCLSSLRGSRNLFWITVMLVVPCGKIGLWLSPLPTASVVEVSEIHTLVQISNSSLLLLVLTLFSVVLIMLFLILLK